MTVEEINGVAVMQFPEKPLPVVIKNFADLDAKPRFVRRTTLKTYIIDPTAATIAVNGMACVGAYEPNRLRTVIQVIDAPVVLTIDPPTTTPELASVAAGPPPNGRYLPQSLAFEYVFYGPDEMYINSITGSAVSRVTVTKEYC